MKPYSNDLRQKVIEAYRQGKSSLREIAERFLVSLSLVWLLVKQFRETGRIDPKPHGGGKKRKIAGADLFVLRQLVEEHSDATLSELGNLFFERTGIKVSESTVWQARRRLRISRKKRPFMLPNEIRMKRSGRRVKSIVDSSPPCRREN